MLIPIRLAPPSPSSSSSSASAAAAAVTPAKAGQGTLFSQTQQQHHPEEWSLIELNGTLSASVTGGSSGNSSSNAAGAVSLGGLPLGQLSFAAPEKPVLVIGAHKLEGEIKPLPKPFLIMQKKQRKRERPHSAVDPLTPSGGGKRAVAQTPMSAMPTPNSVDSSSSSSTGLASPSPSVADGGSTEYMVVGIVRQKLLFQNRPKPIVSRSLIR